MTRIVLATHSRELKMALFLALNALDNVSTVAAAGSTAELLSYGKALRPDVVIIESGLPGRSLGETIDHLEIFMGGGRILVVDGVDAHGVTENHPNVEEFADLSSLIEAIR